MANKPQTWRVAENKYFPCEDATPKLPAAHYEMRSGHNTGVYLSKTPLETDELIEAIDPVSEKVIEEIKRFWERKEQFKKLGMLWKRGMFFWGPPGGGKTSLINIICKWVIAQGGISIYIEYPTFASDGLKMIRDIEPNRPIVVVLEDFEDMMREFSESTILNLIDGEAQVSSEICEALRPRQGRRRGVREHRHDRKIVLGTQVQERHSERVIEHDLVGERKVETIRELRKVGFIVDLRAKMHEKIAIIDGEVLWHGSLNILSHRDTSESMLRLESRALCEELARCLSSPTGRREKDYDLADIQDLIAYGASPRATLHLKIASKANAFLNGRGYVIPDDIREVGFDILRHRLNLTYEAQAEDITTEDVIEKIFMGVEVP